MPKDKKSKKKTIDKLRMVLDENSNNDKNLDPKDKEYLMSLRRNLRESQYRDIEFRKLSKKSFDKENLEPNVIIHVRRKKKLPRKELKPEIKKPTKEVLEDTSLIDVEKVEITEPEFIEVKPEKKKEKEKTKEEQDEELQEWTPVEETENTTKSKEEQLEQKKTENENESETWEPVEIEKPKETSKELKEWTEPEFVEVKEQKLKKEKIQETSEGEKLSEVKFCKNCGTEIDESWSFCMICGNKIDQEEVIENSEKKDLENKIETVEVQPIEAIEKNQNEIVEKPLDKDKEKTESESEWIKIEEEPKEKNKKELEKQKREGEEQKEIEKQEKIKTFQKYKTIDEKTAITLYENGYIKPESIKDITYKELKKIKGIKRKKAKEIIKEINNKIKEAADLKPINIDETSKGKISEKDIKQSEEKEEFLEQEKEIEKDLQEELKDEMEKKKREEQKEIEKQEKIKTFQKYKTIDEKTAITLYENGYIKPESIKDITYKELKKIKGIKRKKAKEIIKEIEENKQWDVIEESAETSIEESSSNEKEENIQMKIDAFEDIDSIDEETAVLLYDNGYKSVEDIRKTSLKNLKKVKCLDKKKAKEINREIANKYNSKSDIDKISNEEFTEYTMEESVKEDAKKINEKIKNHVINNEPVEEEFFIEEEKDVFEEMKSINEKTKELLLKNDVDSLEKLEEMTVKDITKIKGINKNLAKKIKKEIKKLQEKGEESYDIEENPYINGKKSEDEWESYEINQEDKRKTKGFSYKKYHLYEKEITTKRGNKRTIRFFSKEKPDDADPIDKPKGFEVRENNRTGVPYLKRKK